VSTNRKALKEFTFSNGVSVPAGTLIAVASHSTHVDGVRNVIDVFNACHLEPYDMLVEPVLRSG
jgi:hypothetical protein